MKNAVYLIIALIVLYLVLSLALHAVYGPSYPFPPTSDRWRPDGSGGWVKAGEPAGNMPSVPSEDVPILLSYVPLLTPGLLLVLFLFTPLSRLLEGRPPREAEAPTGDDNHEPAPDTPDDVGNRDDSSQPRN